jgi:hydroxymethylpyrimidine/phosphomethylpyrimidine kinase
MTDNYEFVISPEDLQAINDAIDVINEKLVPILIALTPDERRELAKMGDKTVAFVTKAVDYMNEFPELVPKYVQVEPARIDLAAVKSLLPLNSQFTKFEEMTSDSSMLSGSEAYSAALSFYNAVKLQASENVPGAKNVYDDLKARFPRRSKKQV